MKCIQCGHLNPEEYRFCEQCGTELAQLQECPHCAHQNPADYRFCEECGESLVPAEAPATEPELAVEAIVAEPVVEATPEQETPNLLECPACAHQNPLEYRFCEECGESLVHAEAPATEPELAVEAIVAEPVVEATPEQTVPNLLACPTCAHQNPPEYRFCEECSGALITEEVLASEPEPFEDSFVAQPAVEIARAVELPHVEPELPITFPHAPISSRLAVVEAKANKLWQRLNARRASRLLVRLAIGILAVVAIFSGITRFRHPVTENSAQDMAQTTINAYYPELTDVDPTVMEFEDQGEELISFSYMKNVSLKTQDGTDLEYTTGAVVIVNRDTGEIQVINTQ